GLGEYVRSRSVYCLESGHHALSPPLVGMSLFYPMWPKSDRLLGEITLAVPVFAQEGVVIASLGLSAPKHHLPEEKIPEWINILKKGAEEISFSFRFRH
ncbi:MAG: IclR family transcriptional regulator C-terminal domain-containing protein, partial [Synergistaceae bacterium]|nr:IclR family transcriptional regulator C-terminal domain-containing protein [Synergistaceae bacterium]